MYYIFDKDGNCLCSCNIEPDKSDLMERGESFIERLEYLDIAQIALVDGQIQTKNIQTPNTATETEDADPSISNEIMDMAEIILDMSDTIKTIQKGGDTP